jgi:two-component sensor histidine kinase
MKDIENKEIEKLLKENLEIVSSLIKILQEKKDIQDRKMEQIEEQVNVLKNEVIAFISEAKTRFKYNDEEHENFQKIVEKIQTRFDEVHNLLVNISEKMGNLDGRMGVIGTLFGTLGGFIAYFIDNWRK